MKQTHCVALPDVLHVIWFCVIKTTASLLFTYHNINTVVDGSFGSQFLVAPVVGVFNPGPVNNKILRWKLSTIAIQNILIIDSVSYSCQRKTKCSNEPPHVKTNKMACAPSEDSAQPGHPPSLIRVFAYRMKKAWVLSYPQSAQRRLWSDGRMPRLIWVFAGHTVILLVLSWSGSSGFHSDHLSLTITGASFNTILCWCIKILAIEYTITRP